MKSRVPLPVVFLMATMPPLAVACDLLGPELPDGSVPLEPIPAEYAQWWTLAQRCSGLQGDLAGIRWYSVPGSKTLPGSDDALGRYLYGAKKVVLAGGQERNGYLVRHEMLHALRGTPGHPRGLFLEQCGGIVSCGEGCERDAGVSPTWDLTVPLVSPSEVTVEVEVLPAVVSLGTGTRGCVTIVASARNERTGPVTLDVERGRSFSWGVGGFGGGGGGGPILQDSLIRIDPGRVWSYAFDCPSRIAEGLTPGEYIVYTRLEQVQSRSAVLRVIP